QRPRRLPADQPRHRDVHHDARGAAHPLRSAMSNRPASLRRLHPQRGVSLVELMIAITLGLLVLATLASVFANSSRSRTELDRVSRQIENGRFAMEILTSDIKIAGFYGELAVNAVTAGPPAPGAPLPDPRSTAQNVGNPA